MNTPEPSLRDDLSAAFDKHTEDEDNPAPVGDSAQPPAGDATGDKASTGEATPPATGDQPPAPPAPPTGTTPSPTPPATRPPQSWKPEMRERWSTLPPEIQQEVLRREREIGVGLQSASEARRFHEEFNKVAQPYQQYLQTFANGNPLEAFSNYLRTATLLRTGSPQEKAGAVAAAIREYGIDVNILDSALAAQLRGQPYVPQQQQQQPQAQFRDPRVDELLVARQREEQERVTEELSAFANDPKNEFYEDVKMDMADILELSAQRGVKVTLADAYKKACAMNDSVQTTLSQRSSKNQQLEAARKVKSARHAASSTTPGRAAPAPSTPAKGAGTLRDDIVAAMDTLAQE